MLPWSFTSARVPSKGGRVVQGIGGAALASRAIGAMFFSIFGGAWLMLWLQRGPGMKWWLVAPVLVGTGSILAMAVRQFRRYRDEHAAQAETPEKKQADRIFNIVNVTQWVTILIVGNVLANLHLGDWVLAAAILIIGLHFFPLAKAFRNPALHFTGAALVLVAVVYPLAFGPASALGCLGAGLVLWASALRAVI